MVDFERQTLSGSVVMELVAVGKAGKIAEVTLDTRDLDVKGVYAVGVRRYRGFGTALCGLFVSACQAR